MKLFRKKRVTLKKKNFSLPKSKSIIKEETLKLLKLEMKMKDLEKMYKDNKYLLNKYIQDSKKSLFEQQKLIKESKSKSGSNKTLYSKSGSNKTLNNKN